MEPAPILWLTFSLVLTLLWEAGCILLIILWFLAAELITLLATISLALSVHVGQVGAAAVPLAWWLVAETASQLWGIAASAAGGISALPPVARDVATVSIAMSGALAVGWVVQHFMDCEQQQALSATQAGFADTGGEEEYCKPSPPTQTQTQTQTQTRKGGKLIDLLNIMMLCVVVH